MPDGFLAAAAASVGSIEYRPGLVTDLLDDAVRRFADRPALWFQGGRWTYAQLDTLTRRAAAGLRVIGVGAGERVGLCLPNTPYSVILYYAVLRAGAIVVNFNPLYVVRELEGQIADSGTSVMVVPDLPMITEKVFAANAPTLRRVVVCPMADVLPGAKAILYRLAKRRMIARVSDPRAVRYATLLRHGSWGETDRSPEEIAVLQYTGGTTGVPKAAMLSHANLHANARQAVQVSPGTRPGLESMLCVLPLFHVFAMTSIMNAGIANGSDIHLFPRYDLAVLLDHIERERPTVFHAVPTIFGAINAAMRTQKRDLASLRYCNSGGAPLPQDVGDTFMQQTGCKLFEGYGLTEASPAVTCNPPDGEIRYGTVGIPVAGTVVEIRDIADPMRVLPAGERGEVCVRGPQVMLGYWGRPEATAAVMVDGALRTGDAGMLSADGYLTITDRIKDVILCGGYNVYPRVLEEALYAHPAVADAIVIGVADAYRGQAPKAFVTVRPGADVTADALREHLATYVSKIEMPRDIVFRDSLPRTAVGKLSKKELLAEENAHATQL